MFRKLYKMKAYGDAVTSRPYISSLKIVNIFLLNLVSVD